MHGRPVAEIVVIGTSWGGLHALRTLVSALPADYRVPTVIVQHRHRQSDGLLRTLGIREYYSVHTLIGKALQNIVNYA